MRALTFGWRSNGMISIFIDMDSVHVIGIKLIEDIGFKLEIGSAIIKSFGLVGKN